MGKGRSQNTTQTVNQVSDPWGPSEQNLRTVLSDVKGLYNNDLLAPEVFGSTVPEQSAQTMASRAAVTDMATAGNPITSMANEAYQGIVMGDPYERIDAVTADALRSAVPAAASYFQNSGMLNSTVAGEGIGEAAMRAVAPIQFDAYHRDQNRRLQGISMAPQMAGLQYYDADRLGQVGAQEDAYNTAVLADQARQHYEREDQDFNALQRMSGISMGVGGMGGTSSGTQMSQQASQPGIMGILGAGIQSAPFLASLFSDRRLKRNIRPTGETIGGATVYAYDYVWGEPGVGVIADEIPVEFVTRHPSGFDMVDYEALHGHS